MACSTNQKEVEKMEQKNGVIYSEKCPYCCKEFKSLYEGQLKTNIEHHKLACKLNPSNKIKNE